MKKRRTVIICFGIFMTFMAVCTLIAKGIYTSGLPIVTVRFPERKSISHQVVADGTVRQGQEFGVYTRAGLRVSTVLAGEGEAVEAGEPLFQIDTEDLRDIMENIRLELGKLSAGVKERASAAEQERRKEGLAEKRAAEDYEQAQRKAELEISRRRTVFNDARRALEDFKRQYGEKETVSGGDGISDRRQSLEQAEREAYLALEDALLAGEETQKAALRSVEDARLAGEETFDAELASAELDLAFRKKELERLEALLKEEGWVKAGEDGWITDVRVTAGERTADSACLLYALDSGERILETPITGEQLRYVAVGDRAELIFRSGSGGSIQKEGVISYLDKREDGTVVARTALEEDADLGQSVTLRVVRQSDPYPLCVPAEAVHSPDGGGSYLYGVEEREGILGTECRIVKIAVTVKDRNESFAAVESPALSEETRVVVSRNKDIAEGDVVRATG